MIVHYFTLANITLGIIGAVFGTFPYVYTRTLGRIGRGLRKTERLFSKLQEGPLTDLPTIREFLEGIGIKQYQGIVKLEAMTGVMFGKKTLTDWIMAYYADGKLEHLDTKAVSDLFRTSSDRIRNRVAFGLIALGYLAQIVGLVLGMT